MIKLKFNKINKYYKIIKLFKKNNKKLIKIGIINDKQNNILIKFYHIILLYKQGIYTTKKVLKFILNFIK